GLAPKSMFISGGLVLKVRHCGLVPQAMFIGGGLVL
ncbi:hypothetical protein PL2TA16_04496, partial [Pseudoalteromonas luteoviolacea 2ta16]